MDDAGLAQVVHERVDIAPAGLGLPVRPGVHTVEQDVRVLPALGEAGRDLLAGEEVRVAEQGTRALYGLVVRQRDEVHPGVLCHPIGRFGRGIGLPDLDLLRPEAPDPPIRRQPRSPGVEVKIHPHHPIAFSPHAPSSPSTLPSSPPRSSALPRPSKPTTPPARTAKSPARRTVRARRLDVLRLLQRPFREPLPGADQRQRLGVQGLKDAQPVRGAYSIGPEDPARGNPISYPSRRSRCSSKASTAGWQAATTTRPWKEPR